jgi:uncharacterized protein DUF4411
MKFWIARRIMAETISCYGYVIDSSGWISIDGRPDQNRILFHITKLIEAERIKSPPEVWEELKKCEWVLAWIAGYRSSIVENRSQDNTYLAMVGGIARKFPGMAGVRGTKDKADPYVVALAAHMNATAGLLIRVKWSVVAAETLAQRPNRKIPTACRDANVECIGLFEMLRREFPDEEW